MGILIFDVWGSPAQALLHAATKLHSAGAFCVALHTVAAGVVMFWLLSGFVCFFRHIDSLRRQGPQLLA